jgi:hypothetical protein
MSAMTPEQFASGINFGECEVMAQLVARSLLISPLIHKDF